MTHYVEIDLDTTDGKGLETESDEKHPKALFSDDDEDSKTDFDYGPESDESDVVGEEDEPMSDEGSYGGSDS